ncbi:MAG: hypothetical protein ACAI25_06420 [Planctomycetota bacterium]
MARSPWLAPIALLLVFLMFVTGCASNAPRRFDDERGGSTISSVEDGQKGGAQKTRGGEALAVLMAVAVFAFAAAIVIDLITLPISIPCHRPFVCTATLAHCCH